MATAGKKALLKVMSTAAAIPFTGEATTAEVANKVFVISNRTKKYWDLDTAVIAYEGTTTGDVVDSGDYRVQHAGGKLHFYEATTESIVVSGASVAASVAAEINNYTYTINREIVDVTAFKESTDATIGFRDKLANIGDASGTASGFYVTDNLFEDRILSQSKFIMEFDVDQDTTDEGDIFACYAVLESDELAAAIEGAVGNTVNWQSDGDLLVESKA